MGDEGVRTLPSPLGLSDFELGVTLGTGSFGRVRFVTHKVRTYECYGMVHVAYDVLYFFKRLCLCLLRFLPTFLFSLTLFFFFSFLINYFLFSSYSQRVPFGLSKCSRKPK